jgi:hypothetical protein
VVVVLAVAGVITIGHGTALATRGRALDELVQVSLSLAISRSGWC